jgi:hypothetical protein
MRPPLGRVVEPRILPPLQKPGTGSLGLGRRECLPQIALRADNDSVGGSQRRVLTTCSIRLKKC